MNYEYIALKDFLFQYRHRGPLMEYLGRDGNAGRHRHWFAAIDDKRFIVFTAF